jgi:hypothetical protein
MSRTRKYCANYAFLNLMYQSFFIRKNTIWLFVHSDDTSISTQAIGLLSSNVTCILDIYKLSLFTYQLELGQLVSLTASDSGNKSKDKLGQKVLKFYTFTERLPDDSVVTDFSCY